jgi:hypothetical protein
MPPRYDVDVRWQKERNDRQQPGSSENDQCKGCLTLNVFVVSSFPHEHGKANEERHHEHAEPKIRGQVRKDPLEGLRYKELLLGPLRKVRRDAYVVTRIPIETEEPEQERTYWNQTDQQHANER